MSKNMKLVIGAVVAVIVLWFIASSVMGFMGRKMGEKMVENMIEGASGGNADVDMATGKMKVQTSEGTFEMGGDLPSDWPKDAPVYAGATVQYSGTANPATGESGGRALVMMTSDSAADVKAFYEKELTANGWAMQGDMQGGGTIILSATKEGSTLSLLIATAGNQTSITMGIETK